MDGIININKPAGLTSHDVVNQVRKIFNIKKIGHVGTLDPLAKGVLPLCISKATKLSSLFLSCKKIYVAKMQLGVRTDTQDCSGKIISKKNVDITFENLENVFGSFVGKIRQVPPMYSALKYKGVPLYKLARNGIEVKRDSREVEIYSLRLLDFTGEMVTYEAVVSGGTYIRTLCDDIGEKLGCGAHLFDLERSAVGFFKIEDSVLLKNLEAIYKSGKIGDILVSPEKVINLVGAW